MPGSGVVLYFPCLTSRKHKQTRLFKDWEMLGKIIASLQSSHSLFPSAAELHGLWGCVARAARPSPSSAQSGQKQKKVQGTFGPFWKTGRNCSFSLVTLKDANATCQGWCKRVPGDRFVTKGCSPHLWACILQPLGVSGGGLICTVRLWSGFPYADAHYVICPVYLHSLWGPFCCSARLGLKIHVSLFKSICIHIQSTCSTSRGLPLLNKFTDLPLTFILVIYIKSFSRRIEALLYTVGCMNGFSRKLKSIVLSDSISVRCSTIPGVIW